MTDIFKAAYNNNTVLLQRALVEGQDVNAPHPRAGTIPLMLASQGDAIQALRMLLDAGADPSMQFAYTSRIDGRAFNRQCSLLFAKSVEAAEILLDAGADINSFDDEGCTVLTNAVHAGNVELVTYLLGRGARVDCKFNWRGEQVTLLGFLEKYRLYYSQGQNANVTELCARLDEIKQLVVAAGGI